MKHWEGKAKWSLHQIICKEKTITLRLCTLKQHDVTSAPEQSSLLMVQCLCSVSLQWASRVTASHSCWLQHTSFQHMTSSWHHEFTHLHHDWQQTGVILRDCWGRQITHDASFYIMGQFCGAYIFYLKFSTQIWFFLLHYSYLMTLELLLCECMMHQSQSSFNILTFSQIGLN